MNLSNERIKRVQNEIIHTQELLNKELTYREDLQDKKMVSFYENHLKDLKNMINQ